MHDAKKESVSKMNSFLRGEISAVETYRQCLDKLEDGHSRKILEDGLRSHERRVQLLRDWIVRRGGKAVDTSGAWGSMVKLVQGGAAAVSEKAAVKVLEEGEDHGRNDYEREMDNLDPDARKLIENQILPEQLKTHEALAALQHSI